LQAATRFLSTRTGTAQLREIAFDYAFILTQLGLAA
jgi:hypothetical protein